MVPTPQIVGRFCMCASVGRAFRLANARVSESGPSICQSHAQTGPQRGGGLCANRSACLLFLLYDTKILPYTISHPYQSSTASYTRACTPRDRSRTLSLVTYSTSTPKFSAIRPRFVHNSGRSRLTKYTAWPGFEGFSPAVPVVRLSGPCTSQPDSRSASPLPLELTMS